jgi:hypothetical protein
MGMAGVITLTMIHGSSQREDQVFIGIAAGASFVVLLAVGALSGFVSMISTLPYIAPGPGVSPIWPALFSVVTVVLVAVLRPRLRRLRRPVLTAVVSSVTLVFAACVALTLVAGAGCV